MNGFMSFLSDWCEWPAWGLNLAVGAGIWAALLASVVLVINVCFRRWITARQMAWLWGLVLLRLLVPVAPTSSCSLQYVLRCDPGSLLGRGTAADPNVPDPSAAAASKVPEPSAAPSPTASQPAIDTAEPPPDVDWVEPLLSWTWLAGGCGFLCWTLFCQWRFSRSLKRTALAADRRASHLWDECCPTAGLRRRLPLLQFDGVRQPAVFGLFRPRLLLPSSTVTLSDDQLRMVMLHELAHVRRGHIAVNWLLVAIRALHWWNPVYWLAAARFRNLREQSCDAFAIRRLGGGQPVRDYGELLLKLAENPKCASPWNVMLPASILGFLSSFLQKRAIRNRLKALPSAGLVRSRWHTAACAGLIGLVGVCGFTDAREPAPPPDHSSDWMPHVGSSWDSALPAARIDSERSETRVYNIEKAINQTAAVGKISKEEARLGLSFSMLTLLRAGTGNYAATTVEWAKSRFSLDDKNLSVNAPPHVHAEIAKNISAWEESGHCQICIESRLITDERDIASPTGISWQYLEAFSADRDDVPPTETRTGMPVVRAQSSVDDYIPVAVAVLNEHQTKRLVNAAQNATTANIFCSPTVTVFNGQLASILNRSQRPFVVGVQDGDAGPHPKIALIDEGLKLSLRASQSANAKTVHLEGAVELTQIGDVRTATASLRGKPATIQIPRVKHRRIDVSAEIPDGQFLLVECIPTFEEKTFFYLLLTVRRIATN
jgi:bla regulator protein blaR1